MMKKHGLGIQSEDEKQAAIAKMTIQMRIEWKNREINGLKKEIDKKTGIEKLEAKVKLAQAELEHQEMLPDDPDQNKKIEELKGVVVDAQNVYDNAHKEFMAEQEEREAAAKAAKEANAKKRQEMEAAQQRAKELEKELAQENDAEEGDHAGPSRKKDKK